MYEVDVIAHKFRKIYSLYIGSNIICLKYPVPDYGKLGQDNRPDNDFVFKKSDSREKCPKGKISVLEVTLIFKEIQVGLRRFLI
ncbi:MAG: hypothetical protein AVO38_06995 [delta proteobacterium ML8_D]|nr:MAG: hypothetical protein AVO38_06995 [delta proteobacterium ML8_D]